MLGVLSVIAFLLLSQRCPLFRSPGYTTVGWDPLDYHSYELCWGQINFLFIHSFLCLTFILHVFFYLFLSSLTSHHLLPTYTFLSASPPDPKGVLDFSVHAQGTQTWQWRQQHYLPPVKGTRVIALAVKGMTCEGTESCTAESHRVTDGSPGVDGSFMDAKQGQMRVQGLITQGEFNPYTTKDRINGKEKKNTDKITSHNSVFFFFA